MAEIPGRAERHLPYECCGRVGSTYDEARLHCETRLGSVTGTPLSDTWPLSFNTVNTDIVSKKVRTYQWRTSHMVRAPWLFCIGGLAAILQGRTRPCKVAKISNFYKPCEGACIVLDMQVGTSNLPQGQVRFHKACVLPQESDGG